MRFILLWLLVPFFISQAVAVENTPAAEIVRGDFASMKKTMSGRVDAVVDADTVLLKDGKIVRLLGLNYPGDNGDDPAPERPMAKQWLDAILPEGSEVDIYQSLNSKTGRLDRMGHVLAHLTVKSSGQWVNGTLVAGGLARAVTTRSNPELADQLYELEDIAREKQLGVWEKSRPSRLLSAQDAQKLQIADGFHVFEGTVNRAATAKNNLYLNFGTDARKDLTVMIAPALRKALARHGIDPMGLSGQRVRVRGWARMWNGPFVELETAERIQILAAPDKKEITQDPLTPALPYHPAQAPAVNP